MNLKRNLGNKITILLIVLVIILIVVNISLISRLSRYLYLPHAKLASQVKLPPVPQEIVNLQEAFAAVAEAVKPAVVSVSTVQIIEEEYPYYEFFFGDPFEEFFREFFGYPEEEQPRRQPRLRKRSIQHRLEGMGSGVIINPDGYILTNEHVVRGADEIKVILPNNEKKYTGKVVGRDVYTDLAVIKIKPDGKLPYATLGDSDKVRVGEWVVAIGSPFGLEQTITVGIVSAIRQSLVIENRRYKNMIQTDAAINRGNSGGPLVNIRGEVIGINTAIYAPTGVFAGIGFAVPINAAKEILGDLVEKGKVSRGWLGIEIRKIDEAIMKQFNLPDMKGVLVNNVLENTPAEKAGLRRGDVVREVNGEKVESPEDLQNKIFSRKPGERVVLKILRDKKEQEITVKLGELPEKVASSGVVTEEEKGTRTWLGMEVQELNEDLAEKYNIPKNEKGVVVMNVKSGSKAEEIGLQEGDLIKSINRYPTTTVEEFEKISKKVVLSEGVVFDILRNKKPLYLSYIGEE
jgi:serine protease Do